MATAVGRVAGCVAAGADRLSRVIVLALDLPCPAGSTCVLRVVDGGGCGRG